MIYLRNAPETLVGSFCSRRQSGPASKPQAHKALSSQRTPNASPPNVQTPAPLPLGPQGEGLLVALMKSEMLQSRPKTFSSAEETRRALFLVGRSFDEQPADLDDWKTNLDFFDLVWCRYGTVLAVLLPS